MKTVLRAALSCPFAVLSLVACSGAPEGSGEAIGSGAAAVSGEAMHGSAGAVFTIDNAAAGNDVLAYERGADGTLTAAGTYPTGGLGTGVGLGSASSLAPALDGSILLVVNAGSSDISSFVVSGTTLKLRSRVSSGGLTPSSLAVHGHLVYALNEGTPNGVSGLRLSDSGELTPIPSSTWPLSADSVGPAQVGFSPDGDVLIVTEKTTNDIDVLTVGFGGVPIKERNLVSTATTPFGFTFTSRDALLVTDAFGGVVGEGEVSSYTVDGSGLSTVSAGVADGHTAPCWIAASADGHHAYAANAHDGTISAYSVGAYGKLTLDSTISAGTGSTPLDLALDPSSTYLYNIDAGNHAIVTMARASDGSLTLIGSLGGLPAAAGGLVVL